jgi:hypothetical protein
VHRKLPLTAVLTLFGLTVVLGLLFIYIGYIWGGAVIPMAVLASMCLLIATSDESYIAAIAAYLVTVGLGGLITSWESVLGYVCIAHVIIFRAFINAHIPDKLLQALIKLFYFNALLLITVFILGRAGVALAPPLNWPVWTQMILLQAGIIAYDLLSALFGRIYDNFFKELLFRRR